MANNGETKGLITPPPSVTDHLPHRVDPNPLGASAEMFPKQYPRVLVTNFLPHVSQTVLKQHFEGCQGGMLRVLDIELFRTGETCSAIVTFDDTRGVQTILESQKGSLKLAGQELQLSLLCTESTTFTISNLKPDLDHKVIELAKGLNVAYKLEGNKLSFTGPIEFVHHLRIELDAHIVQVCGGSTARMLPANMTPTPHPSFLQSSIPPGAGLPASLDSHPPHPSPLQLSPPPGAELSPSPESHPPMTNMTDHLPHSVDPNPLGASAEMFPKQYPRVLVTNFLPHVSQTVLKQHFEGCQGGMLRVLDIEWFGTGETCSAIVTFDDTRGVQTILVSQNESLKLAGQELQLSLLCTESTTFIISDLKPDLYHKVIELAKRLNVAYKLEGSKLSFTGPIEFVHHLRIEFDTHIVQVCGGSTAHMLPANMTPTPHPSPQLSPPPTAELPPSPDPHPPTTSDSPLVFSDLSPDILALLEKVPEGNLPGVQYDAKAGMVCFESQSKEELEDHIAKFQTAYQGILGMRRLKVEPIEVPPALDDEKVAQTVSLFNEQYSHCVLVYYKDPRVVKVVSISSRQFDKAKRMLVESLASQPASSISAKVKFSHREEVIGLPGGRKLTLKKANIVEEKVDVIVNAANRHLQHGDGVARAINSASHGEVQKYSNRYISRKGPVPVGQGTWTNAGGTLKCKFVFHAVGPDSSHIATECKLLLTQVVKLALLRADKANHTSIAIPAISSGVNKDLVAQCVIDTILNFHFTKSPPVLSDIRIVIIDSPTYSCFARYFIQKQELLKQAPRKPLVSTESQSAGIGQFGHPNTVAGPTSEPPPLKQGKPSPLLLPQGQLDNVRSESNLKPQSTPPLPTEEGQLVDVKSEGNLEPGQNVPLPPGEAADGLQSAKGDENLIPDANAISYPALYPALPPLDREGDSSTSHHPGEQLPNSSGHGQPPQKRGEVNPSSGIPTSPTPTTATHTKISTVPVGTDPLSLPTSHCHGQPHMASLQRSWSVPVTVATATTGTMTITYSQVATTGDGDGGGVPSSKMNAGEHAITQQPHGSHTHRQPHGKDKQRDGGGGVSNGHRSQCDHSGGHNKGDHRSKGPSATAAETEKDCPICLDGFKNPTRTECGHQFCSACLSKALQYDPYCPTCKHVLRPIVGKQPQGGQMTQKVLHRSLPGYEGCNTIQISYYIPSGVQGQEHPNPGRPFTGTSRTAYLPDTYEGREVLELLWKAFNARLTFTVGTSVTSGAPNAVVWDGIPHKTSMHGGTYGYPDPTYLQRVKEDLASKGFVPDSCSTV